MSDGLGSVRGWLDGSQNVVSDGNYNPYGVPDSAVTGFGFTSEMTDANGLVYLRARYYDPNVGVFASLDPFEGVHNRPMSVNGYSWVEGNVANWVDASGMTCDIPYQAISLVPLLNQNAQRCPTPMSGTPTPGATTHNLVKTQDDSQWLNGLKFCKNGYKNDNLYEIMDQITETYGFNFPQRFMPFGLMTSITVPLDLLAWDWDDLAGIGRGAWLISKALGMYPNTGESTLFWSTHATAADAVKRMYSGTSLIIWKNTLVNGPTIPNILAQLALVDASAVVPPPGFLDNLGMFGPAGNTVYLKPNTQLDKIFIHEMGHVLDFALGARFNRETLNNRVAPSSWFYAHLQSQPAMIDYGYNTTGACSNLIGADWGACIASRGVIRSATLESLSNPYPPQIDYYNPSINFPAYGNRPPDDHFEDFAATWEEWVLDRTNNYHGMNYSLNIGKERYDFMTNNVWRFFTTYLRV